MAKLNILPSQRGKLPSEPDMGRLFGIEYEFNPDSVPMGVYRIALHKSGIDTFDDGCEYVRSRRRSGGESYPDPERLREPTQCMHQDGRDPNCGSPPRGRHLERTLSSKVSVAEKILDLMGGGGLDAIRGGFEANGGDPSRVNRPVDLITLSWGSSWLNNLLADTFPRPDDTISRFWDLGTDPTAGFELRSVPARGGEGGFKYIEKVCDTLRKTGAVATGSCGTHIHKDLSGESAKDVARITAVYRLVEPLLAAPVEPSRYFNGYNTPSWSANQPTGKAVKDLMDSKNNVSRWNTGWLATQQLQAHNSYEFRGLEGTLEASTVKNYTLLLNRFIQATIHGEEWGVKLKKIAPIGVTPEAIRALFKHLDLVRDDLSDELKEMREWYLDRVRQFKERNAFQNSLVVGKHERTEKFAQLKELRETGKSGNDDLFEEITEEDDVELSDKEVGLRVYQAIEDAILNSRADTRGGIVRLGDQLERLAEAPREIGTLPVDSRSSRMQDDDRYNWFRVRLWENFCEYVENRDFNSIGAWYKEHIDADDVNTDKRRTGLAEVIRFWIGMWARSPVNSRTVNKLFKGEEDECVDF